MDVHIFVLGWRKEVQLAGVAEMECVLLAAVPNTHEADTLRPNQDQEQKRSDLPLLVIQTGIHRYPLILLGPLQLDPRHPSESNPTLTEVPLTRPFPVS